MGEPLHAQAAHCNSPADGSNLQCILHHWNIQVQSHAQASIKTFRTQVSLSELENDRASKITTEVQG